MKVLVTGGAGFIGSHLVDELMTMGKVGFYYGILFKLTEKGKQLYLSHNSFS